MTEYSRKKGWQVVGDDGPEIINFKRTGEPRMSTEAVREYMKKRYGGTGPAHAFWREYDPTKLPQIEGEYE